MSNGNGSGENTQYPDDLQPGNQDVDSLNMAGKFSLRTGPALLDTLDDPSQLIQGALDRGVDLSVAEVILAEILSTMRQRTHHSGSSAIVIPVEQAAAGYTRLIQPGGNQIVRVRTVVLSLDTGTGTVSFVHGTNGSASDAQLSGAIPLSVGNPLALMSPNPRENPLLFTSPGAVLGLVSATNKAHGWVVVEISEGGEN